MGKNYLVITCFRKEVYQYGYESEKSIKYVPADDTKFLFSWDQICDRYNE